MSESPWTVRETDSAGLALQMMGWAEVRNLPVVRGDTLLGVVSERDLLANRDSTLPARDLMTAPPQVAGPMEDLGAASKRMVAGRLGCLPVLLEGRLIGILTLSDVVRAQALPGLASVAEIPVSAAMTADPMTVSPDDFLVDAIRRLAQRGVRHAPVTGEDAQLEGMLSDRDIRLALGVSLFADAEIPGPRVTLLKVRDVMARGIATVKPSDSLATAASLLVKKSVGALPVLDGQGRLVGIVSYVDILRVVTAAARAGPAPHRGADRD